MADLSKIKLNGIGYDLKDGYIRDNLKLLPTLYYEKRSDWKDTGYILYKDELCENTFDFIEVGEGYGQYLVWLTEFNGDDYNSIFCIANKTINYTTYTPIIYLEAHDGNSILKFHIISGSNQIATLYYDGITTSEPLIITADWLGTDWEVDADRGGRCFENSSLTLNEFKQAVNNHKDIYLRLYNRRNEECTLYNSSTSQHIYFIPENSHSNDLSLNYNYYLGFDNYYDYGINLDISFIYQMGNIAYLCSGGLYFYSDNGTDICQIEISSISDLSTSCPTLATVATSGSYNDLDDKPTIPNVPSWALNSTKPTYTASEVGATTASDVNSAIATAIGNINQFEVAIITNFPTTNINTHTIYFKSNSSSGNNVYDEYMYINNNWELIGSTQIDLTPYALSADLATVATSGSYNDLSNTPTLATVASTGDYDDLIDAPVAETDANVETMLDSFNLDYTNNSSSPNMWTGGSY